MAADAMAGGVNSWLVTGAECERCNVGGIGHCRTPATAVYKIDPAGDGERINDGCPGGLTVDDVDNHSSSAGDLVQRWSVESC